MLHHAGVKAFYRAVYGVTIGVKAGVTNVGKTRNHAAHSGYRQAAFPVVVYCVPYRRDDGVDQDGAGNQFAVGVAGVGFTRAKNHHLQIHPNLRRGKACAVGGVHGVQQISYQ